MSNWFESNATKSIISYTLIVAGTTWAASTFILQDNRLSLLRGEADSQKTLAEQYKSKVELLQRELDNVRAENAEYRVWLGKTKDAVPVMVPRLTELKARVDALEAENKELTKTSPKPAKNTEQRVDIGRAYLDEGTGLIFTLKRATVNRTAEVIIRFPGRDGTTEQTVNPGQTWDFQANGKKYSLVLTEVSFIGDYVTLRIAESS